MKPVSIKGHMTYSRIPSSMVGSVYADSARDARTSMAQATSRMQMLVEQLRGITKDAVQDSMQQVFDLSQMYCPVKTGALKESGHLDIHEAPKHVMASIAYGAQGGILYAALVHERVDLYHEFPTRAKFLQAAYEEVSDDIATNITAALRAAVGG